MQTVCDYCNKFITKPKRQVERYKHHFCDRRCYHNYRIKFNYQKRKYNRDISYQRKIKQWARMYNEKRNKSVGNIFV